LEKAAIIGLGLIGGSIGLALNEKKIIPEIVGYTRTPANIEKALARGAITQGAPDPASAVKDADLVIIATPVWAILEMMEVIAPHLKTGALVTDVGSTKVEIVAYAQKVLPEGVSFIGGHPMAGKEVSGIDAAEASLLEGCRWILTPAMPAVDTTALDKISELIIRLGANPIVLDAAIHDYYVAAVSHVPFILSIVLMETASSSQEWSQMSDLAASGFIDMTRLAGGEPQMYEDICRTNSKNISFWLQKYMHSLRKMHHLIADTHDQSRVYRRDFEQAQAARREWLQKGKDGGDIIGS